MVRFPMWDGGTDDEFICKACNHSGKLPFVACDSDEDSDDVDETWTQEDEYKHRQVKQYQDLVVGKSMRGGTIHEVFPGLDKFTAAHPNGRIEHLINSVHEKRQGLKTWADNTPID